MRDVDRDKEQHFPLAAAGQKKKKNAVCSVNVFKNNKVDITKRHFQQMYTEFETFPVSNQKKNRINEISPLKLNIQLKV